MGKNLFVLAEETVVGGLIALLCLLGLGRGRWLLEETRKGQRLARWLGPRRGLLLLRLLLGLGLAFGLSLAAGLVEPVRW